MKFNSVQDIQFASFVFLGWFRLVFLWLRICPTSVFLLVATFQSCAFIVQLFILWRYFCYLFYSLLSFCLFCFSSERKSGPTPSGVPVAVVPNGEADEVGRPRPFRPLWQPPRPRRGQVSGEDCRHVCLACWYQWQFDCPWFFTSCFFVGQKTPLVGRPPTHQQQIGPKRS